MAGVWSLFVDKTEGVCLGVPSATTLSSAGLSPPEVFTASEASNWARRLARSPASRTVGWQNIRITIKIKHMHIPIYQLPYYIQNTIICI